METTCKLMSLQGRVEELGFGREPNFLVGLPWGGGDGTRFLAVWGSG